LAGLTRFPLRQRNGNNGDTNTVEITVSDYYRVHRGIELKYSDNLPCINAGRLKRPTYFPVEVCFSFVFYILKASSILKLSSINLKPWFVLPALHSCSSAKIHQSSVYSAKVLTCREIQTKASRKNVNP
jgi:hypothetical protein